MLAYMHRRVLVGIAAACVALVLGGAADAAVIARGTLVSIGGEPAAGVATLAMRPDGARTLTFTKSAIGPGPALHIYLVAGTVNTSSDVKVFKDLGRLKRTTGTQSYSIPRGLDTRRFRTAVVWCADFNVAFGKALLTQVKR